MSYVRVIFIFYNVFSLSITLSGACMNQSFTSFISSFETGQLLLFHSSLLCFCCEYGALSKFYQLHPFVQALVDIRVV